MTSRGEKREVVRLCFKEPANDNSRMSGGESLPNRYTVRYHRPMSAHASQAFSIASCTDSEDLPLVESL